MRRPTDMHPHGGHAYGNRTRVRRARGAVLAVSLMMLAVILILGLGALRLATTEERMAGYAQDRQLTFQAAEAALRELEERMAQDTLVVPASCGNAPRDNGQHLKICPVPAPLTLPYWIQPETTDWDDALPVGPAGAQITPSYRIENLGSTFACDSTPGAARHCIQYRITVRAGGGTRAEVMLQSTGVIKSAGLDGQGGGLNGQPRSARRMSWREIIRD